MFKTVRIAIGCCLICVLHLQVRAQQTHEKMVRAVNYLLYLPDGYAQDSSKSWPLMIFLHGSGERGDDLEKLKVHGPPKLIEQGKKFPFIVVSPQADQSGWDARELYYLLQECKRAYRVDADRVYLTGLSMGGFGTWDLAIRHPEEFAAIVPICGGGDTAQIWKLRNMPVWCFHGAKDSTVPIAREQIMISALQNYNPSVRFTVYPDAGHDSWTTTYNNDSLYQWLLSQKRFRYQEATINSSLLKEYPGNYVSAEHDTVIVSMDNDKLFARTKNRSFGLKPASGTVFFIDQKLPMDIRFSKSRRGKVTGFTLYENKKMEYKRI
jgi:dienelactone hydrolase